MAINDGRAANIESTPVWDISGIISEVRILQRAPFNLQLL